MTMRDSLALKYLLCTIIGASDFLIATYGSALDSEVFDALRVPRQLRGAYKEPCELPEYPQYGNWSLLGDAKGSPGQMVSPYVVLKFECNDGYKLSNNNYAYTFCEAGRWTPNEKPKCLKKCPPLYNTATTTIKCRDQNNMDVECDGVTNGASARFACAPFYEPSDRAIRVCIDGAWNVPPVICRPVCGRKKIRLPTPLIINGQTSKEGNYPWAAVIYHKRDKDFVYVCAGSLLSQRVIVTAAHCVTNDVGEPHSKETIAIGVGKYYNKYNDTRDATAQYSKVEQIIVPDLYRGNLQRYASDIAVIVTTDTLLLSKYVQPVCYNHLPNIDLNSGSIGTIPGYRFPRPDEKGIPEELYELDAVFKPAEVCFQELPKDWVNKYYTYDKMCAEYTNKTICINSGGGLVFKNSQDDRYYIHGILSIGLQKEGRCSTENDPLYTKVAVHYDWLEKIVAQYTIA